MKYYQTYKKLNQLNLQYRPSKIKTIEESQNSVIDFQQQRVIDFQQRELIFAPALGKREEQMKQFGQSIMKILSVTMEVKYIMKFKNFLVG